jgi:hypothetical protein
MKKGRWRRTHRAVAPGSPVPAPSHLAIVTPAPTLNSAIAEMLHAVGIFVVACSAAVYAYSQLPGSPPAPAVPAVAPRPLPLPPRSYSAELEAEWKRYANANDNCLDEHALAASVHAIVIKIRSDRVVEEASHER